MAETPTAENDAHQWRYTPSWRWYGKSPILSQASDTAAGVVVTLHTEGAPSDG